MIGAQSLTVWSSSPGAVDRKNIAEPVYTAATWTGCNLQPMDVKEQVTAVDYTLDKWSLQGPPTAVGLKLKADDFIQAATVTPGTTITDIGSIQAGGAIYRVIGAKPFPGFKGVPHHVEATLIETTGLNA